MSSCPGKTLEEFLLWNYDLVNEEIGEDPNPSLSIAEALGTATQKRPFITKEQMARIAAPLEPFREGMEYYLQDFNEEDHGSWRDYSSVISGLPTKEAWAESTRVMNEITGRNWKS